LGAISRASLSGGLRVHYSPTRKCQVSLLVTTLIVRVILSLYTVHPLCLSLSLDLFPDTMASSSAANSGPARDEQMLNVGRQCSHPTCHLVDFLPFKCQHCANSFCSEHFKPASHSCAKYDEAKYNRVAPDCEYRPRIFSCRLVQPSILFRPSLQ
jgi:AN1-like Zinc finger